MALALVVHAGGCGGLVSGTRARARFFLTVSRPGCCRTHRVPSLHVLLPSRPTGSALTRGRRGELAAVPINAKHSFGLPEMISEDVQSTWPAWIQEPLTVLPRAARVHPSKHPPLKLHLECTHPTKRCPAYPHRQVPLCSLHMPYLTPPLPEARTRKHPRTHAKARTSACSAAHASRWPPFSVARRRTIASVKSRCKAALGTGGGPAGRAPVPAPACYRSEHGVFERAGR